MKKSAILKKARELIANRKKDYICHALEEIWYRDRSTESEVLELKSYIRQGLAPYCTYNMWLKYTHPEFYYEHVARFDDSREGRVQWLDWMIAHFESKGE